MNGLLGGGGMLGGMFPKMMGGAPAGAPGGGILGGMMGQQGQPQKDYSIPAWGFQGSGPPAYSQKPAPVQQWMGQHPQLGSMLSGIGNGAQSPMTHFGLGMMGGGGVPGGVQGAQGAMQAQRQQQMQALMQHIQQQAMANQSGGLGGGGGPAPASIY